MKSDDNPMQSKQHMILPESLRLDGKQMKHSGRIEGTCLSLSHDGLFCERLEGNIEMARQLADIHFCGPRTLHLVLFRDEGGRMDYA